MQLLRAAFLVLLVPSIAAAQNRGIFIQGGAIADVLFAASADVSPETARSLSAAGTTYEWYDLNGDRRWQPGEELSLSRLSIGFPELPQSRSRVTPGGLVALGVFITPSVSLRVEGSFQGEHVTETDHGDLSPLITIEDRQASSMTDVFVAAGWHQGDARRTTITYLGGMVFRRQRDEAVLRYTLSDRVPPLPPQLGLGGAVIGLSLPNFELDSTTYTTGVMAGVDVTINLSQRLAVVPQVRMVAANRTWSLRPGVAMRWRP